MSHLDMWTVYENPSDYPGHFVTRQWRVGSDGARCEEAVIVVHTLEQARMLIPPGLHCQSRSPDDDPVIVETWF